MVLKCGHAEGALFRYRHKGKVYKFCMGCVCEKHPEALLPGSPLPEQWGEEEYKRMTFEHPDLNKDVEPIQDEPIPESENEEQLIERVEKPEVVQPPKEDIMKTAKKTTKKKKVVKEVKDESVTPEVELPAEEVNEELQADL